MANAAAFAAALHDSGEETSSGTGTGVDIGTLRTAAELVLEVTAAAGALNVTVETSANNTTGWRTVGIFAQQTNIAKVELAAYDLARYVRVKWIVTGTVTFEVTGTAHQVYFGANDVYAQLPAGVLQASITSHDMADAIMKGSGDIEDACNGAYTLPLISVPHSVRQRGAAIAVWRLLQRRGVNPSGTDEAFYTLAQDADKWLMRVSQGKLRPPGIVDSAPTVYEGGAAVVSSPKRQW